MSAFLITTEAIKKLTYIEKNVEDSLLRITIIRVQDNIIKPIIGTSLFKRLVEGIIANDLNSNETELLNDYITPALASAVDYKIIYPNIYKTRNKTVGANRDETMTNASTSEASELRNEYRKDFEPYRKALIGYLKDNEDNFPEYKDYVCNYENIAPDKGKTKTVIRFA